MISYSKSEKIQSKFKNNIEVISFDAGYTLLEPNPSFGGILAMRASSLNYQLDPYKINERLFEAHHKYVQISREQGKGMYACEKQSRIFWDKIFEESYGHTIKLSDCDALANRCYDELAKATLMERNNMLNQIKELEAKLETKTVSEKPVKKKSGKKKVEKKVKKK